MLKLTARTLHGLTDSERNRLQTLTQSNNSVFAILLRDTNRFRSDYLLSTLAIIAIITDENNIQQWVGWTLAWWQADQTIASVGVFVAPEYRKQGLGSMLIQRIQYALIHVGFGLRSHATSPEGKQLFKRYNIENV